MLIIITAASPCPKPGSAKGVKLQKKTQRDPEGGYFMEPGEYHAYRKRCLLPLIQKSYN